MCPRLNHDFTMIHHTVFFTLRHPVHSDAEQTFLSAAMVLATIPGVDGYAQVRQLSAKNAFALGFLMSFADDAAYQAYNAHPDHERVVRERWVPEVADFLEIDYAPL